VGAADGVIEERTADETVLALGAWSPPVARTAGVRLPIQPAKGYSATVRRFPGAPSVPFYVAEPRVIVTPLGDVVRIGGTLELAGFTPGLDRRRYEAILKGARSALADPGPLVDEAPWFGYRPLSPDSLPFIGRSGGQQGLLIAAGHGTLGFTQSLATGLLISELAEGKPPRLDLTPFSPDRFGRTPRATSQLRPVAPA